jgi:leader peptidase (prepilin peptidase)/N-methyltransferase
MLYVWVALVFLIGAAVGSFINVCVARLPFEKSILWPQGSRCGHCLRAIRWYDNLPLVSYWALGGRCRFCGQRFGISYFLVELLTACAFAGLFYLEIGRNALGLRLLQGKEVQADLAFGVVPWQAWVVFGWHALLLSFLITTSLCDLQHMEVPLPITVTGTVVGLVGSAFLAWPFPNAGWAPPPADKRFFTPPDPGLYPWPVWKPWELPAWLPPGSWQLGLATGLAGALAGLLTLRGIRFLFGLGRGKEGLGIGDADVMMMAGSFIGWQPTLVAFFVGVFAALFVGLAQLLRKGDHPLAFSPALAVGVATTLLTWRYLGAPDSPVVLLFGNVWWLGLIAAGGAVILLLAAFLLRLLRGAGAGPAAEGAGKADSADVKKV